MSRNTKTVLALLAAVLVLAVVPFFLAPGAEFGGSDDAGSRMVEEIQGEAYEPWFTPVLETLLGGELPGEIESLLFCIQTGVGVGVLAYGFGPKGLARIWCSHYAGNWRSARVITKCGFLYAFARTEHVADFGEDRQTYFYVLTKEGWRERVSGAL